MEYEEVLAIQGKDISDVYLDTDIEYDIVILEYVTNVNNLKVNFKAKKVFIIETDLSIFDYNNDGNIIFGLEDYDINFIYINGKVNNNILYSIRFTEKVKKTFIVSLHVKNLSFNGQEKAELMDIEKYDNILVNKCSKIKFTLMNITQKINFIDTYKVSIRIEDKKHNVNLHGKFTILKIKSNDEEINSKIILSETFVSDSLVFKNLDFNNLKVNFNNLNVYELKILKCKNLENINLKFPKLTNLTIKGLKNFEINDISSLKLHYLNLSEFDFRVIVFDYERFPFINLIKKLIITNCNMKRIFGLESIQYLEHLDLSKNKLDICPAIPKHIVSLNLSNNKINEMCDLNLKNLMFIDISDNKLYTFPKFPKSLSELSIGNNPIDINKLKNSNFSLVLPYKVKRLRINGLNLYEIDKPYENIELFDCSNNNLSSVGTANLSEYKNLKQLYCSYNNLDKLPILPKNLEILFCNNNKLEGNLVLTNKLLHLNASFNNFKNIEINSYIKNIDVSHNILTRVPKNLNNNIDNINLSYNQISSIKGLEKLGKFCKSNIEGNPIEDTVFPEGINSKLPIERRRFKPSGEIVRPNSPAISDEIVDITTIPKGTVLFRGYFEGAPSYKALNDLIGFPMGDGNHRVIPYTNVFFYGAPFVSEKILGTPTFEIIFVLTKDIKVIHGLLPSLNYRSERYNSKYLINCDKAKYKNFKGNDFDPCISEEFIKQNPDVVGSVFLAEMDVQAHKCTKGEEIEYNKYQRYFNDVLNTGVPEFILTPSLERTMQEKVTNIKDITKDWLIEHKNDFNYYPLYFVKDKDIMKETVDALLSPQGYKDEDKTFGFDTLHMSIDKETKLYIIEELADENVKKRLVPRSEENKLKYI